MQNTSSFKEEKIIRFQASLRIMEGSLTSEQYKFSRNVKDMSV